MPSLFLHSISVVRVYFSIAATTQDPAGQDPHQNFPNLAKEIDFQEVQEAHRIPKKFDPRKHTPRYIIITLANIKDNQRILKAVREKQTVTYKGVPRRL